MATSKRPQGYKDLIDVAEALVDRTGFPITDAELSLIVPITEGLINQLTEVLASARLSAEETAVLSRQLDEVRALRRRLLAH